ncbi:helix-turn-helix transcriptional regulator [Kitasatospora herbaricolor]|uniref:Helix-turn-helix domain-containing protein n=1 Tax=Kitasatospora herbaricolor TaxID=68217 RepID=A0ABZ1WGU6_9ACTN|nr:helix-turn-helix transcriptional regulator [Kitasatospora herbaricolor]
MTMSPAPGAMPPGPEGARTPAEFVAAMRRLRRWSGLSFRELERRATAARDVLPRATLDGVLRRSDLPREDLLVAFVRACGAGPEDVARWTASRRHLTSIAEEAVPEENGMSADHPVPAPLTAAAHSDAAPPPQPRAVPVQLGADKQPVPPPQDDLAVGADTGTPAQPVLASTGRERVGASGGVGVSRRRHLVTVVAAVVLTAAGTAYAVRDHQPSEPAGVPSASSRSDDDGQVPTTGPGSSPAAYAPGVVSVALSVEGDPHYYRAHDIDLVAGAVVPPEGNGSWTIGVSVPDGEGLGPGTTFASKGIALSDFATIPAREGNTRTSTAPCVQALDAHPLDVVRFAHLAPGDTLCVRNRATRALAAATVTLADPATGEVRLTLTTWHRRTS